MRHSQGDLVFCLNPTQYLKPGVFLPRVFSSSLASGEVGVANSWETGLPPPIGHSAYLAKSEGSKNRKYGISRMPTK